MGPFIPWEGEENVSNKKNGSLWLILLEKQLKEEVYL
jgi:hypothetical protein